MMLSVILVTFVLFFSFHIVRMLTTKILLDHAAARAARAKAVGMNDFMCIKAAQVAVIPVAGRRVFPEYEMDEVARLPIYMSSSTPEIAAGVMSYQWWPTTFLDLKTTSIGTAPVVRTHVTMETDDFTLDGSASVEGHYPLYMNIWE